MGDFGALKFCLQANLQPFRQAFLQSRRNALRKKDAALVEATLFRPALGGTGQFIAPGIQNIRGYRLQKAGGIILFGLSCGQETFNATILEGLGHRLMDGLIGGKGAGGRQGMVGGQNKGVGEVATMLDQPAPGVATHKRLAGGNHGSFLKISDRDAGRIPFINPQHRAFDVTQEGLVDRHVAGGGGWTIEKKTGEG